MFVRLRPDFSAVAAKTHVSDSAVPWRGASTSYDQVHPTWLTVAIPHIKKQIQRLYALLCVVMYFTGHVLPNSRGVTCDRAPSYSTTGRPCAPSKADTSCAAHCPEGRAKRPIIDPSRGHAGRVKHRERTALIGRAV